jgi:DNA-binding NtrC family response regulator
MSEIRTVLAALVCGEECASIQRILSGAEWALRVAPSFSDAEAALRSASFGVVICGCRLADGSGWQDVLARVQRMPVPPQLIVAHRLADEVLWAEVLNLGCYDLLTTPFAAEEVLRVVPMAWDFWKRELERTGVRPKPPKLAKPKRDLSKGFLAAGAD